MRCRVGQGGFATAEPTNAMVGSNAERLDPPTKLGLSGGRKETGPETASRGRTCGACNGVDFLIATRFFDGF